MTPLLVGLLVTAPPDVSAFEAEVRPILVEHCYGCHGETKQKGGLRLDTRAGVTAGGESGPAVVPGKPDASRLISAVRYADPALRMPPTGKLSAKQVAALERWVQAGAPDPRDGRSVATVAAADHWAFRPVRSPLPPADPAAHSPVDAFVRANLRAVGLSPSPPADRPTLLRRVYFDLHGLPPTFEQVEAFATEPDPAAFEKVVDGLLASPRFGERWGRHWLDVARYADTKDGVLLFGSDRLWPFAYTYRDYVIRAFNADVPFDRFVQEQLAADLLGGPPDRLAAMGFLTLGRGFDGNPHDVIDDRIDVVGRGLLGLTVACARCHDHKSEPIPTADYYALHGVFAASEAPLLPPRLDPVARGPAAFEAKYSAAEQAVTHLLDQQFRLLSETARRRTPDYLVHVATTPPDPTETAYYFRLLAPDDLRPQVVARWRAYLGKRAVPADPVFGPWARINRPADIPASLAGVNPWVAAALRAVPLDTPAAVARAYGAAFRAAYQQVGPPDPAAAELLAVANAPDAPAAFPKSDTRKYLSSGDLNAFGSRLQELDKLAVAEPSAPGRAECLGEAAEPGEPRVFVRGNPSRPGPVVERRFLSALGGAKFGPGSGRLDLAKAITDPANPLTARVFVNRVWMHLTGEPLVETPSDFGVRTPRPVQADLLDHLAAGFVRDGWSVKRLIRGVVLSDTYRQSSGDRPEARASDPTNARLWRASRRRLDLEAMRDGTLAASGRLEHKLGGRPTDAIAPTDRRRTVYGLVDRQSLPGLYRAFDFANPDQSAERRPLTAGPQQALFALNSPFVHTQATALAAQATGGKARALHRLILLREPTAEEQRLANEFVASAGPASLDPWARWAQVLLMSNEFHFVD